MEMKDIKKVLIVGAGTMGQQIAFQCAAHGYKVILYDMNEAALVVAQQRLTTYADDLIAGGYLEKSIAEKPLLILRPRQTRRRQPGRQTCLVNRFLRILP